MTSAAAHKSAVIAITAGQPNREAIGAWAKRAKAMPKGQLANMTLIAVTISRTANRSVTILVITRLNNTAPAPLTRRSHAATPYDVLYATITLPVHHQDETGGAHALVAEP